MKNLLNLLRYEFGETVALILSRLLIVLLFGSVIAVFLAIWYEYFISCSLAARVLMVPINR